MRGVTAGRRYLDVMWTGSIIMQTGRYLTLLLLRCAGPPLGAELTWSPLYAALSPGLCFTGHSAPRDKNKQLVALHNPPNYHYWFCTKALSTPSPRPPLHNLQRNKSEVSLAIYTTLPLIDIVPLLPAVLYIVMHKCFPRYISFASTKIVFKNQTLILNDLHLFLYPATMYIFSSLQVIFHDLL